MTDDKTLVERLREGRPITLYLEAADRIEALEAELILRKAEAEGATSLLLDVQQDCIKANQENERLRALLGYPDDGLPNIEQMAAEINRLRALTEWQPMETAPTDGTEILAAMRMGPLYVCSYRGPRYGEPSEMAGVQWRCSSSGRFGTPTHWMPLPTPPKDER